MSGPGSDPAPEPDALMVFDGVCVFCSGWVRLALRMDRDAVIRFVPIQSAYGQVLCERHGVDAADPSTFLFVDRGRALGASDAVAAMFARMPLPWRLLSALRIVPRPLRDGLYGWVARNRYRLLGKRPDCLVPTPETRARFLFEPPERA